MAIKVLRKKRRNTLLESTAAEFFVLGNLLLRKIPSYLAYRNFEGFDIVATNPANRSSCTIQVKARFASTAKGFPIKNFDCDFVVFVKLNRGKLKSGKILKDTQAEPQFFVFPVEIVKSVHDTASAWQKVSLRKIENCGQYENAWHLISEKMDANLWIVPEKRSA